MNRKEIESLGWEYHSRPASDWYRVETTIEKYIRPGSGFFKSSQLWYMPKKGAGRITAWESEDRLGKPHVLYDGKMRNLGELKYIMNLIGMAEEELKVLETPRVLYCGTDNLIIGRNIKNGTSFSTNKSVAEGQGKYVYSIELTDRLLGLFFSGVYGDVMTNTMPIPDFLFDIEYPGNV